MILPADLSEGWWWVRWAKHPHPDWPDEPVDIHRRQGLMLVLRLGTKQATLLDETAIFWTAMERVAPPRWESGDG